MMNQLFTTYYIENYIVATIIYINVDYYILYMFKAILYTAWVDKFETACALASYGFNDNVLKIMFFDIIQSELLLSIYTNIKAIKFL